MATLTFPSSNVPPAINGTAYSWALDAFGGTSPYTWVLSTGTLPSGITLTSGTLAGTASAAEFVDLVFTVTDSATPTPNTAQFTAYFAVAPALFAVGSNIDSVGFVSATVPASSLYLMVQAVAFTRDGSGNKIYADLPTLMAAMLNVQLGQLMRRFPSSALLAASTALAAVFSPIP